MFRGLAGHEENTPPKNTPKPKPVNSKEPAKAKAKSPTLATPERANIELNSGDSRRDMALTVRIEINLPAGGSKETYDNIFKSIRANLIDA